MAGGLLRRYAGDMEAPSQAVNASLPERLRAAKAALERELQQVNEALDALEANPELEKVIHLVTKVGLCILLALTMAAPVVADESRYDPQGRRDPFMSLVRPSRPAPAERPAGMLGFLMQEVALKGIVKVAGGGTGVAAEAGYIATLLGPDGKSYFVRTDQRLYDATIIGIGPDSVTFRQYDEEDGEKVVVTRLGR